MLRLIHFARRRWPLLLLLVLLTSALWHPFTPWVEEGVRQLPATGVAIRIPPLQIILEPLAGPLLFISRADAPLPLYLWTIGWLFMLSLAWQSLMWRRQQHHSWRRAAAAGLRRSLARLPFLLMIAVALLLLVIFLPFPAITIDPGDEELVLVNLHSHTYYSHDGLISPSRLLQWHRRNGFDAFFLTEHNHHGRTLALAAAQARGELPAKPLILAGHEYSGSNHLLLLGLTRDFDSKDYSDRAAVDSAHSQGGAVVLPHWFSPHRNTRPLAEYLAMGIDGVEIVNQGEGLYYPEAALQQLRLAAANHGLLLTGNADYHGYGPTCLVWNALRIPGWRQMERAEAGQAILEVLRRRDQTRLEVLIYRDRTAIPAGRQWLSPWITALDYFRSLRCPQLLSWLVWAAMLAGARRLLSGVPQRLRLRPQPGELLTIAGMLAAVLTILTALWMLSQVPLLGEENRIFLEYGLWLAGTGALILAYGISHLKKLKNIQLF